MRKGTIDKRKAVHVLAANILNKHGARVERSEREKWETQKYSKAFRSNIVTSGKKYQNSDMEKQQKAFPAFIKTEPWSLLCITAPEPLPQTLQMKVYTNRQAAPSSSSNHNHD